MILRIGYLHKKEFIGTQQNFLLTAMGIINKTRSIMSISSGATIS